jgi:general L-amino acid transport system permease protein
VSEQLAMLVRVLPDLLFGFKDQRPGGLLLSVLLALVTLAIGFLLAIPIASGRSGQNRVIRMGCTTYIEVFRGLPLILLLVLVHQGLGGRWGFDLTPYQSSIIALSLYTSAYQSEIIRAGLQAVPLQLIDSAAVVGASRWRIFWRIRLRYALRVMVPALTGQAISLFKDTSVVVVLGVGELLTTARAVLGSQAQHSAYWVTLYILVGLLYMVIAAIASRTSRRWEPRHRSTVFACSSSNTPLRRQE